MLRIAIVGCGKIADQHAHAIGRIPDSELVAVCDSEARMAEQLAERFRIGRWYSDMDEMLRGASPQAVHITTPPQSHHDLAIRCLEAGCHVYVEKPFTVTAVEAESLLKRAESHGLVVMAGHNYQFTPEMMEMRRLVHGGLLGGLPVHLESHWSYDLGDTSYVGPLVGNPNHWVRRLPGQLIQNIISHGVARLAEFLDDDIVTLTAIAHQSEYLRSLGGSEIQDELRVLLKDKRGTTASFCFSTQMKPGVNRLQVYGPRNSIEVDLTCGSVLTRMGRSYKSYLTFIVPPWIAAIGHAKNAWRNASSIARGRLHQDSGMKQSIEFFHRSAMGGGTPPIPYREVLLTARIMDAIFAEMEGQRDGARLG